LPEAHTEPPPAPETEPLPGAALARALFYGSRLRTTPATPASAKWRGMIAAHVESKTFSNPLRDKGWFLVNLALRHHANE
jgi:hypothetical protein